jgi:hypothetical protein
MYRTFNLSQFKHHREAHSYWKSLSEEEKGRLTAELRDLVGEELVRHFESTLNHKLENK